MHDWIADVVLIIVAVGDLSVAFLYAAQLEKNKREKGRWLT
jgi:hypothetical protein